MQNPKGSEAGAHNAHPSYLHASGYPMSAAGLYLQNPGHFYDRNNIPMVMGGEDVSWMSHAGMCVLPYFSASSYHLSKKKKNGE